MVLDGVANFVRVSTAESVDSSQTSLTVTDAGEFPSEDHNAVLWDSAQYPRPDQDPNVEIIRVTAVDASTDTLTISRGQENTAAVSHPTGSAVAVAPTAKIFSDIESELQSLSGGGVVIEAQGEIQQVGDPIAWDTVATVTTGREFFGAAAANGRIYAVGGRDSGGNTLASVEEYDPSTDSWTNVAPLNTPRENFSATEVNNRVYAIGGRGLASVEKYNPETDSWTTVASLSSPRERHGAAAVNGRVYAIGGGADPASVEKYNPDTDSWTTVASLNTAREYPGAVGVDGLLYAVGGRETENFSAIASVEVYDPDTDSWADVSSLQTPRNFSAAVEVDSQIYAIGGLDSNNNALGSVEKYDPSTDSWTSAKSLNTARERHSAAVPATGPYAISGRASGVTNTAEKLEFEVFSEEVFTATGDTIVGLDDSSGTLTNKTTGRTGNPQLARDGETIAALTKTGRVFRTEES